MIDLTDLYEFVTNDEYKTIKDFIVGSKVLILGLNDNKYLPESFPDNFSFRAYDLKPPEELMPRVDYFKANARNLNYELLSNEFKTIISHNLCEHGNAQVINELINELTNFETIIIKFCDNPSHYKDINGLSETEKVWFNALSLEEQLNNFKYNTKLMWTRWKKTNNEIPYLLIATKKTINKDITINDLIYKEINKLDNYLFNTVTSNEEFYRNQLMIETMKKQKKEEYEGVTINGLREKEFNKLKQKKKPFKDNVTLTYFERIIN